MKCSFWPNNEWMNIRKVSNEHHCETNINEQQQATTTTTKRRSNKNNNSNPIAHLRECRKIWQIHGRQAHIEPHFPKQVQTDKPNTIFFFVFLFVQKVLRVQISCCWHLWIACVCVVCAHVLCRFVCHYEWGSMECGCKCE